MAIELLVRAVNNVNPQADQGGLWKRGEVVVVKPVPHDGWGSLETLAGGFWRITIEGVDFTDPRVELWIEGHTDLLDDSVILARRKRWIDLTALPNRIRNALSSTGIVSVRANETTALDLAVKTRI